MDAVAREAGVGKGTVFRRFGDKAGLAAALLDERERELQEAMLSGPPPLGPGADDGARAEAFVRAYLRHLRRALDVVRLSRPRRLVPGSGSGATGSGGRTSRPSPGATGTGPRRCWRCWPRTW
jgi:AcrR family transcriptional regulator